LRTMLPASNLWLLCWLGASKPALADRELSVNLFRSPSMGTEYREAFLGIHAGFYPTVISRDAQGLPETTWFLKFGATGGLLWSPDHSVRLNPTPGVGWSFPLRQ
jgi:hypothetical protein